jgi:UPF0755 protein
VVEDTHVTVRHGPSRRQVRRRRFVALAVGVLVIVGAVVGAVLAIPHVHRKHTLPPPPPPPRQFRIIFPEGFTRAQMIGRVRDVAKIAQGKTSTHVKLSASTYASLTRHAFIPCVRPRVRHNLEGYLFPSTYNFEARSTSARLVRDQLGEFCDEWRTLDLTYARSKNLTDYDVLKIASMVEEETVVPGERPLVAAVIYNRLHLHMPLQIDATLRYGLHIPGTKSILKSQLESPSPYNTRHRLGLPPTPIANPGLPSLEAAAHPAKVDYLYYARKRNSVHQYFTASGPDFQRFLCANGYGC